MNIFVIICFLCLLTNTGFSSGAFFGSKESESLQADGVRFLENIFDEVDILKDIKFASSRNERGEMVDLLLDVYAPAGDDAGNRPVMVWIHGGGFRGGDKTQGYIVMMANRFAKKGYVCLSVDYRLRVNPKEDIYGTITDAVEDAGKGLAWLRANSENLRVDTTRIVVGGGSAGGILASNLCLRDQQAFPGLNRSGVIGFVNLWGSPGDRWGELEISDEAIPTVIVHGTDDKSVLYAGSVKMKEGLDALGVKNDLITIEGAGHTPVKHIDDFEKRIARFLYDIVTDKRR